MTSKTLVTTITPYRFDIGDPAEAAAYRQLCARLEESHPHAMVTYVKPGWTPPEGRVELDTTHLFANQWNAGIFLR